ncbi:hypothetical protein HID58_014233, partial [Brassica napus]
YNVNKQEFYIVKLLEAKVEKQTPPYADETVEMVLADKTVSHKIHASCNRSHMFRIQRDLMIRKWRVIENFKVSGVGKGKYSPC